MHLLKVVKPREEWTVIETEPAKSINTRPFYRLCNSFEKRCKKSYLKIIDVLTRASNNHEKRGIDVSLEFFIASFMEGTAELKISHFNEN